MSRFSEIREVIPNEGASKPVREIIAALPHLDVQRVREAVGYMYRWGILARSGSISTGYRYWVVRAVKRKRYDTEAERREGKRRTDAARNRRLKMPLAEWTEVRAKRTAATIARREAERADRNEKKRQATALRRAERAEAKASLPAKPKAIRQKRHASPKVPRTQAQRILAYEPPIPSRTADAPAPAKVPRVESVAEWMARTGKRPQVLEASWNQRRDAA